MPNESFEIIEICFAKTSLEGSAWHPIRCMLLFVRYLAKILGLVASGFKRYDEQNSFFTQAHTALYLQLVSSAKKGGNVPFSRKKYMRTCFVLILCDAKTRVFSLFTGNIFNLSGKEC